MEKIIILFKKAMLNRVALLAIALTAILLQACSNSEEECGYKPCQFSPENSDFAGWTVATCYSNSQNDPVGVIYNTSMNSNAVPGTDWGASLNTPAQTIHPGNWIPNKTGQVFGIAIDKNESIYLASSGIYNNFGKGYPGQTISYDNGTNSGKIYKSNAPTWTASLFISLPTSTGKENDIGNIAYDKVNHQLFATNLEDGKLYRITGLNNTTGTIAQVYDPWNQDGATSPLGIVSPDEQIWGIGVNYEQGKTKIYFPRITSTERSIYSITLEADGSFPTTIGNEVQEITNIPGTQNIISDLAFSSNTNELLIAERGDPHKALVTSHTLIGGNWNFNKQYFVGPTLGKNTAGGVDFAYKEQNGNISTVCDEFFWASGNYMLARQVSGRVYGLEGIKYSGNTTSNSTTDIFIDFNPPDYSPDAKNSIGDVEVFDANSCFDLCKL